MEITDQDVRLHPLTFDDERRYDANAGTTTALADLLEGRPLVVNFFSSTCVPCVTEMPEFEAVHQDLRDEVSFVGLATLDKAERALELVEKTGVSYPTFSDPDGEALLLFEAPGLPVTVFITAAGDVREVHVGRLTEDELRDKVVDTLDVG